MVFIPNVVDRWVDERKTTTKRVKQKNEDNAIDSKTRRYLFRVEQTTSELKLFHLNWG